MKSTSKAMHVPFNRNGPDSSFSEIRIGGISRYEDVVIMSQVSTNFLM